MFITSGLPVRAEAMRFVKKMPCNEVPEAEEMLNNLFPGALDDDVSQRVKSEIENIDERATCISGVEFHLKNCQYGRTKRGLAGSKGSNNCKNCKGVCVVVIVKERTGSVRPPGRTGPPGFEGRSGRSGRSESSGPPGSKGRSRRSGPPGLPGRSRPPGSG